MVTETRYDIATRVHASLATVGTTTFKVPSSNSVKSNQFAIGISLALLSSLFIGSSFILKKKGLIKLTNSIGAVRAGSGGFGYLYEIQWWAGLIIMGLGEVCNFAAYGFAPASVVTPLGALSVLVSALMAVRFLGESLNTLNKIGCFLTISGSIILVIHAPKESDVHSLLDFAHKVGSTEFLFFSSFICMVVLSFIFYFAPRLGTKHVAIYILICSLLGAFTVTACKGLAVGLQELFTRQYTFSIWLTVLSALTIVVCIAVQMVYLNKALDLFATPIVTTVYYVFFTTCVLVTSGVLFREWHRLAFVDILACLVGFAVITCGLVLINYTKTNPIPAEVESDDMNDESLLSSFSSSSQCLPLKPSASPSVIRPAYIPIKTYAHLLLEEENLAPSWNSRLEQRQCLSPMYKSNVNC